MKKLVVLAAFVSGIAMAQQASACDWMHEAAAKPATVVTCDNGNCTTEQATQQAATTATAPAPQAAPAEQAATPMTVAASGSR
jgi:hypothetical protein